MDWTIKPYCEANHPPVIKLKNPKNITAKSGERIKLSVEGSTDPDGDQLSYNWFYYWEPGTFTISTARTGDPVNKATASVVTPVNYGRAGAMHIIVAITDNGIPALTIYERVIVTVNR